MQTPAALRHALYPYKTEPLWQTAESNGPLAVNPSLSLRSLKEYPAPDTTVAVWDTRLFGKDSRAVGFLNGRAKMVSASEWDKLRAASGIINDVPAPPAPPWWKTLPRGAVPIAVALLVAVTAMVVAAGLEARFWPGERGGNFTLASFGWFLWILFGYSSLILLVSLATAYQVAFLASFWAMAHAA